ncbi:MAG TPA: hypothetical protein VJ967_10125 [Clostridia bacterium]|nr:hypothetical protein [Clostridia bacterium]
MERKVSIKVDGKKVPINKFVYQITKDIIVSIVDALHDTNSEGTIEITVGPRETKADCPEA